MRPHRLVPVLRQEGDLYVGAALNLYVKTCAPTMSFSRMADVQLQRPGVVNGDAPPQDVGP